MTKVISLHRNKSKQIKPRKREFDLEKFKSEKNKALLTLTSIIALIIGSLTYRLFPDETINSVIAEKTALFQNGAYMEIFFFLLTLDIVFIAFSFLTGTGFLGGAFSFLSPFLKCILIGYIGSYFYNEFNLKGVLFCLLLIYPYFVVTTASLIFASNESIYMSGYIFGLLRNKNTADDISVRLYLMRYLLLCGINIVCTAVNSGLIAAIAPRIILR